MSTPQLFQKAAEDVKNLKSTPSNEELLELYALFKQGSVGDVNTGECWRCAVRATGCKCKPIGDSRTSYAERSSVATSGRLRGAEDGQV